MKILLRSCFISGEDKQENVLTNIVKMRESGLGFEQDTDRRIWEYIQDFVGKYHHPPSLRELRDFFGALNADEVVNRVEHLASLRGRHQGAFLQYLETKAEDRRKVLVSDMFSEAGNILRSGIQIKGQRGEPDRILQGPVDALNYVIDNSREIVAPTTGHLLSGTVNEDVEDFLEEYRRTRDDPKAGKGQPTGIGQIDEVFPGAKPHELWIHAAYTGGMKSTFMVNWAYNNAMWIILLWPTNYIQGVGKDGSTWDVHLSHYNIRDFCRLNILDYRCQPAGHFQYHGLVLRGMRDRSREGKPA